MISSEIDEVVYPSIAGDGSRKGGGMNMARKAKNADELFVADHVWTSIVEDKFDSHGYVMGCIRNATSIQNGEIIWE